MLGQQNPSVAKNLNIAPKNVSNEKKPLKYVPKVFRTRLRHMLVRPGNFELKQKIRWI